MTSDKRRAGGFVKRSNVYYARVRVGGKRPEFAMHGVSDDATAAARSREIAGVAKLLVAAGRPTDVKDFARDIGACTTEKQVRVFVTAAKRLCEEAIAPEYEGDTFEQFAERWTSGALHLAHPDHVAKKQSEGDVSILKNRINPFIGSIPIGLFRLEDADRVMRELPPSPELSTAYRRAVAQVIHRLLSIAVFPARLLASSPLPKGWLPKIGKPKAKSFLYPAEEAKLLAHVASDVRYRLLVGFLNREGMRKNEAKSLEWSDFDLGMEDDAGTVTLDDNKTDAPRSWVLDPGVVRALREWKKIHAGGGPFTDVDVAHLGEWQREALLEAGVERPQLFKQSDKRLHYRAHDTRSTFVTLSLANGKTEAWVMRRTAHKASTMLARYTVAAANAEELGLGPLLPLDEAIPELRTRHEGASVLRSKAPARAARRGRKASSDQTGTALVRPRMGEEWVKNAVSDASEPSVPRATPPRKSQRGSPSRARTGTPFRARDFKSPAYTVPPRGRSRRAGARRV